MYIKATNGIIEAFPYTVGMLRKENPNTSFPPKITLEVLASYNVSPVTLATKPLVNAGQVAVKNSVPNYVNGAWIMGWTVRDMTQEELDRVGTSVRLERNVRLADCDWTQLADAPLTTEEKAAWATYRQDLRDISDQSGFPTDITWPSQV